MAENWEQWKRQLETLPVQERAELAYFLLHTLNADEDADAEAAWQAELERRVADIKNGNVVGKPADQVFAELREKYS
jgi:putative addiction module component (TIGR02574 family)